MESFPAAALISWTILPGRKENTLLRAGRVRPGPYQQVSAVSRAAAYQQSGRRCQKYESASQLPLRSHLYAHVLGYYGMAPEPESTALTRLQCTTAAGVQSIPACRNCQEIYRASCCGNTMETRVPFLKAKLKFGESFWAIDATMTKPGVWLDSGSILAGIPAPSS